MVSQTTVPSARSRRPIWRIILTVFACIAVASGIYVRNITKSRATPPLPLPVPNAYDGLVKVSELVPAGLPNNGNFQTAAVDELKAYVSANQQSLNEARNYIAKPSRVPLIYDKNLEIALQREPKLRQLARLIFAEGELALQEKRFDDAARAYLDLNQFGPAIGRGGIWLDVLVGVAIETMGQTGLRRAVPGMSQAKLREALKVLREVDDSRETFANVKNTENYWSEQSQPFYILLMLRMNGGYEKLIAPTHKAGETAIFRVQMGNRQLQFEVAKQLYAMDSGKESDDPALLVPTYLPEIPKNPRTGQPITEPAVSQP